MLCFCGNYQEYSFADKGKLFALSPKVEVAIDFDGILSFLWKLGCAFAGPSLGWQKIKKCQNIEFR